MNRRDFLAGMLATATAPVLVSGSIPTALLEPIGGQAFMAVDMDALAKVYVDYWTNVICFGCGGLRYTETFPYIESIDPKDIVMPLPDSTAFQGFL